MAMNNETMMLLERHFDAAFAAPDGIKKLRKLILTLAMRGKLVSQDPNDEPASELLKSIEAEKQQLIEGKKLKVGQLTSDSKKINQNIEIPSSWIWVKGVDLFFITKLAGFEYTKHIDLQDAGEVPVIRAQNVKPFELNTDNLKYIDLKTSKLLERCALTKEALLVTFIGAGIGDIALFDFQERWHLAPNVAKMEPFIGCEDKINLKYITYFLNSRIGRDEIFKHLKSTAQPSISMGTIRDIDYPLAPLAEQRRIVTEIDRLMARCDELEKLRADRSQKLLTVHTAALDALLKAKESSDFSSAWHFITQNFSELYSVKENVAELRKTILQLAVMGKLVPQDPNDEPASELLKAIELERQRMVNEGKIKDQKPLSDIRLNEMPFLLPVGWEWIRLGKILPNYQNGLSKRNSNEGIERIVIRLADIKFGEIFLGDHRSIKLTDKESEKYELTTDDILITRVNGSTDLIGNFTLIEKSNCLIYCDHFIRLRILQDFLASIYLCKVAKSSFLREQIISKFVTTAGQKTVNQSHISSLIFPLPPIAEQHRIVAEIDRLMALCDRLEESIEAAKSKQTDLLNALMSQV
jgi:type I restriction enzyme, S subunit